MATATQSIMGNNMIEGSRHISSLEFIWHFTCLKCNLWWSIPSMDKWQPRELYCPHCGDKQDYSIPDPNEESKKFKEEFFKQAKNKND